MKMMFKAVYYGFGRIELVMVSKATDRSVWIGNALGREERCVRRATAYERYFDSWDEAHAWLLERALAHVDDVRRQLELANSYLGNIKGMKEPVA